jgi:hypothetical protein
MRPKYVRTSKHTVIAVVAVVAVVFFSLLLLLPLPCQRQEGRGGENYVVNFLILCGTMITDSANG